ncbi:hypothetical protein ANCDUO_25939, partial [Ancylostoma duodenale]
DSVDDRKALLEGFELLKKQLKKLGRRPTRMMRELRAGDLRSGDKIDQIQVDSALPLTKISLVRNTYAGRLDVRTAS